MTISEFVLKHDTTIDTVKYYIKMKLLTPEKKNHWYFFSLKEDEDFENIVQLKSLGLSLDIIKQIKESHENYCGTIKQWQDNLAIIQSELKKVKIEQERLNLKKSFLVDVETELHKKINKGDNSYEDNTNGKIET